MSEILRRAGLVLGASVLFAACSDENKPVPTHQGERLPSMSAEADAERWPAPTLCDWAGSVDAIVIGEVSALHLSTEPAIQVLGGGPDAWEWAGSCSGVVEPAMRIDLRESEALLGDVGPTLSAYAGLYHTSLFNPAPALDSQGRIRWEDTNAGDLGDPIYAGQRLGFALHAIDGVDSQGAPTGTTQWSLMGEALFTLDTDGRVVFQKRSGEEVEPEPIGVAGLTLDELRDALRACPLPDEEASARSERVRTQWGPEGRNPGFYRAGVCFSAE